MSKLLKKYFLFSKQILWKLKTFGILLLFMINKTFATLFDQKYQNFLFKMKLGILTSSNILNSMVMFTFSVLDWRHPFGANLVQKNKIVFLRWNLVLRPIQICWIWWWWWSFVLLWTRNIFFLVALVQKTKTVCLRWKLVPTLLVIIF